jgi:hypothetical protein
MPLEIVEARYRAELQAAVSELKKLMDGEIDERVVTRAWASFRRINEALSEMCPNHP